MKRSPQIGIPWSEGAGSTRDTGRRAYLETHRALGHGGVHLLGVLLQLARVRVDDVLPLAVPTMCRARQITAGGGMKRRDKEIRKQPSGDPSSGGIPALQQNPGIFTTTGISARVFPDLFISSFHSTPVI